MNYMCPKCRKVYKKNGKWLRRHMIEVCHCSSLTPIELVEMGELEKTVEKIVKKLLPNQGIIPIRREAEKYISTVKVDFTEVVKELKEAFKMENFGLKPWSEENELVLCNEL